MILSMPAARTAAFVLCSSALIPAAVRADEPAAPLSSQAEALAPAPASAFEPALGSELGGDGRRTTSRFVPNLGRNIVGVFSKENLRPLLFGVAASGLASRLDGSTENFFGPRRRAEDFGEYGQQVGSAAVMAPVVAGLFAYGRASGDSRMRGMTYDVAQAFIVNGLYTTLLKEAVSRPRPDGSNNLSFPSGHASNAFALATVVNHHYGNKLGIPAYAVAGLIGASRLESNVHHLSDVVAGAALGVIVGRTVVREDGEPATKKTRVSVMPMTDPSGSGVGAALNIAF